MRIALIICSLVLTLSACEKDPEIDQALFESDLLSDAILLESSRWSSKQFFVMAGNHYTFENDLDQHPIHVWADIPESATDIRYFETDTLAFRDSFELYSEKEVEVERLSNLKFVRLGRKKSSIDRFVRISYRSGDSLYLSDAVEMRGASRTTETIGDFSVSPLMNGFTEFNWQDVPGTDEYLLVLNDREGICFMAVKSFRRNFQFYDLRFVSENLTDTLNNPELVPGEAYTLNVFALTSRNWMLGYGANTFTAPF